MIVTAVPTGGMPILVVRKSAARGARTPDRKGDASVASQQSGKAKKEGSVETITAKEAIDELVTLSMQSAGAGCALIGLMSFEGAELELVDSLDPFSEGIVFR